MKLIDKVEYCLKNFPYTANSDVQLTLRIIHEFHNSHIKKFEEKWWTTTEIQKKIREDQVKRYRAAFNKKGLYMPTEPEVIKQRSKLRKVWRNEMSDMNSNPANG